MIPKKYIISGLEEVKSLPEALYRKLEKKSNKILKS